MAGADQRPVSNQAKTSSATRRSGAGVRFASSRAAVANSAEASLRARIGGLDRRATRCRRTCSYGRGCLRPGGPRAGGDKGGDEGRIPHNHYRAQDFLHQNPFQLNIVFLRTLGSRVTLGLTVGVAGRHMANYGRSPRDTPALIRNRSRRRARKPSID